MIKTLKNISIFSNLIDDDLKSLSNIIAFKNMKQGNILFYEGESPASFYMLIDGEIKIYKTGMKSQEIVLHYFNKPCMIAEMPTLENINYPATAIIMKDDTLIGIIDKNKFINLLKHNSNLSFHMIMSLSKKIKNLEAIINKNLIFDATTKVCSMIKEDPEILIRYKNIQIANLLNMTPETFSRITSKLKKLEIIDHENKVIDMKKLDMFLEF